MNKEKSDYWKGLSYFCCLMLCICLFFALPDGDSLFYKFLGLFGISPGIKIGNNSTLYIYMLIPLIIGILSIKKILTYWWHYGTRFKGRNAFLRYVPVFITVVVFLISANIDTLYYAVISQRSGLRSVGYYSTSNNSPLSYKFTGDAITYSYDFTFENCSNKTVEFKVKLTKSYGDLPEVFIKDDDGEVKIFTLSPKQRISYRSEFTEYYKTGYSSGNGYYSMSSLVLLNDKEQYTPKPITKNPGYKNQGVTIGID